MLAGAAWREGREWERAAWAVAHLLNVSGKALRRSVTADELLGKPRRFEVRDPHIEFDALWADVERLRAAGKMSEN